MHRKRAGWQSDAHKILCDDSQATPAPEPQSLRKLYAVGRISVWKFYALRTYLSCAPVSAIWLAPPGRMDARQWHKFSSSKTRSMAVGSERARMDRKFGHRLCAGCLPRSAMKKNSAISGRKCPRVIRLKFLQRGTRRTRRKGFYSKCSRYSRAPARSFWQSRCSFLRHRCRRFGERGETNG